MHRPLRNVAVCAPATPLKRPLADRVLELAKREFPGITLHFHEQCFEEAGHFAGPDGARLAALLECANDDRFDAVWFAKGGYGSNRIAQEFIDGLDARAGAKTFIGYSDCGTLLGALYRARIGLPVHGPMPVDIGRSGGDDAIRRILSWMQGDDSGLEPRASSHPRVAFNLYTLAMLAGTRFMPDLTGHEVLIEEVGEYEYAIDRLLFHLTQFLPGVAGIRLGEVTAIPENDRPFGAGIEDIVKYWCDRAAIAYLGRASIGHTASNRIVPFGLEAHGTHA